MNFRGFLFSQSVYIFSLGYSEICIQGGDQEGLKGDSLNAF